MIERIGKYTIIREIGRGMTATVYLAEDPFARRRVAIKVAFPEILRNRERGTLYTHLFLNEASLVGKLEHPHIVQIYDAVVADDLCYIVMEYVDGGTLEAHCRRETLLPIERVVEIIFKCTRALDHAGRLGITHRDIKPANILLRGDTPNSAEVKISDFGAAIVAHPERTLVSGVGSPAYMSPQQIREQPLDQQTDIYSLGVVMYQLLTGQLPFPATTSYQIIYQIINTEPTPPSAVRSAVPAVLDRVVARAMCKDTRGRYPNWEEFAHDLVAAFRHADLRTTARGYAESEQFHCVRELPFFSDFADAEIWEVLRISRWLGVGAQQHFADIAKQPGQLVFVAEGGLALHHDDGTVEHLTRGDCFGDTAAVCGLASDTPTAHATRIVARGAARLLGVDADALRRSSPGCRMHFYESLLRILHRRIERADAAQSAGQLSGEPGTKPGSMLGGV